MNVGEVETQGTNKTRSSQVGAISKAQKYSKNNYWKHLEKFLKKKFENFFFEKNFFRKSHNAEKLKKSTLGSIKILWFSVRIEPPLSGFRNLVEDEQDEQIVKSGPLRVRLSTEKNKKKKTTHCKSRAFFLKGKGAD